MTELSRTANTWPAGAVADKLAVNPNGLYPSARVLSFCWHSLIVAIETPTKGREGVQQNASLANG